MNKFPSLILALVVSCGLTACSDEDDIDAFIRDPGVQPTPIEKLPKTKVFPTAEYDRNEIKDPFGAKLSISRSEDTPTDTNKDPLELFPLDGLKMIGYVKIDGRPYALVQDPEMQVHRVTAGQKMGQNYGKIVQITREGIQLKESIQDNAGGWLKTDATIPYSESDQVSNRGTRFR